MTLVFLPPKTLHNFVEGLQEMAAILGNSFLKVGRRLKLTNYRHAQWCTSKESIRFGVDKFEDPFGVDKFEELDKFIETIKCTHHAIMAPLDFPGLAWLFAEGLAEDGLAIPAAFATLGIQQISTQLHSTIDL